MRRHSWGQSIGSRRGVVPFRPGLRRSASQIGWRLLRGDVSLAALSIAAGVMSSAAGAATLNLDGGTVTLPDGVVFTTPFLTGANNVTNNPVSPATGTLIEGGGPAGTTYSGIISDGTSPTAWTHTGGDVTITGANTFTGETTIEGGTVALSGAGSIANSSGVFIATGGTFDISQTSAGASITTLGDAFPADPGVVNLGSKTLTITAGS